MPLPATLLPDYITSPIHREEGTVFEVLAPFAWQINEASLSFYSITLCISVWNWCTESQIFATVEVVL